jgi:Transglutaminase-like superfamily/TgpA N-terminal domain
VYRHHVSRTVVLGGLASSIIAWNWLRLEANANRGQAALILALALVPALVPGVRRRLAATAVVFLLAAGSAFDVGLGPHFLGRVLSRFGGGFVDFYEVQLPFDPTVHAHMHGVVQLAAFAFALAVALAVAARRTALATVALLVGAGWPATLLPGHDLLRGAVLLLGLLVLIAGLRSQPWRGLGYAAVAAGVVVVAALAGSSSPALAKHAFVNWQTWSPYARTQKPVEVSYVWDSDYSGFSFPAKPTTVLRIKAPSTPEYWRATVLSAFSSGRWIEDLATQEQASGGVGEPGLVPRAADAGRLLEQHVTVEALRDTHLVGGSVPVSFHPSSVGGSVQYDPSGIAYVPSGVGRGDRYDVSSYSAEPTPAELARSKAVYPQLISLQHKYLGLWLDTFAPAFGTRGREAKINHLFTGYARANLLAPYRPLYETARRVAGAAKSPYAAAVALESWFRTGGGFIYDQHPPQSTVVPTLVDFVTHTRRGYCQHFSGAMALMLRYLGIPARVAAGFTSGRYSHGEWIVTDREAHTWVEVWFRGWGWLPFDPTPSRGGLAGTYSTSSPQFSLAEVASVLAEKTGFGSAFGKRRDQLGLARPESVHVSPDVPILGAAAVSLGGHRSRAPGLLSLLVLVLAVLLVAIMAAKLVLRRSRYLTRDPRRLASACRRELRDILLDQQVDVPVSATLRELAELVESEFGVGAGGFGLHATAARFGPVAGARVAAREMRRELRGLRRRLRTELTRLERARGLVSLRSLGLA